MTIKLSVNMIQTASSPRVPFRGLNPAMEGLARMRVLLFVLVVAAPCFSQSTWSGLRFGMTPAEVRLALKDRPNKSRTEPAHPDLQMPELFFIDVPNVTVGEHKGTAHLGFDRDQKLDRVGLDFSRFSEGCFKDLSEMEAVMRIKVLTEISETMVERFGKLFSETGTSPMSSEIFTHYGNGRITGSAKSLSGKRIWLTEGQVIDESFTFGCGSLALMVSYKPPTKNEL